MNMKTILDFEKSKQYTKNVDIRELWFAACSGLYCEMIFRVAESFTVRVPDRSLPYNDKQWYQICFAFAVVWSRSHESARLLLLGGVEKGCPSDSCNYMQVNSGLIKMYQVEVLSKLPIMQHFLFGSILSWERPQQWGVWIGLKNTAAAAFDCTSLAAGMWRQCFSGKWKDVWLVPHSTWLKLITVRVLAMTFSNI